MELTLHKLTRNFSKKAAVSDVTVTLNHGVYGLLGANGAGKTTIMSMICGVLSPTSGSIQLDGKDIFSLGEDYRTLLGYLPQNFGYYPDFSAEEFMLYISSIKGLSPKEGKRKTRELLELVALSDMSNKKIRTFSGGMKQRLGIAQALINDPRIVVLDEPTAGLDPKERVRFRNLISELAKDKLILLSTHIVSDVEYIANEILVMKKGRLLMNGTVSELTATLENHVWHIRVPATEADKWCSEFCVSNLKHEEGLVELRVVSQSPPSPDAVPVMPVLEDLYLYYFQDEQKQER